MDRRLLTVDQLLAQLVECAELFLQREYGAAGVAEDDIDARVHDLLHEHPCPVQFLVRHDLLLRNCKKSRKIRHFRGSRGNLEAHAGAVNRNWRILLKISGKILSEYCSPKTRALGI